jgi:hypothetical protein
MVQHQERDPLIIRTPGGSSPARLPAAVTTSILFGLLIWASSCDALTERPGSVYPEIRFQLEQPLLLTPPADSKRSPSATPDASYQVVLQVTNQRNEDFSPDPLMIADSESEARLTLSLPPENDYRFDVRFLRGSTLVAEGAAIHHVRSDTRVIEVPIVPLTAGIATVGFIPGRVRMRSNEEMVDLRLRLYGTGSPVAGLVCRVDVEGLDTGSLAFSGADIVRPEPGRLDLAWSWSQPVTGDVDLGVLRVPRAAAGTVRFRITSGNLRSVSPEGNVNSLQAVGAVVEITP